MFHSKVWPLEDLTPWPFHFKWWYVVIIHGIWWIHLFSPALLHTWTLAVGIWFRDEHLKMLTQCPAIWWIPCFTAGISMLTWDRCSNSIWSWLKMYLYPIKSPRLGRLRSTKWWLCCDPHHSLNHWSTGNFHPVWHCLQDDFNIYYMLLLGRVFLGSFANPSIFSSTSWSSHMTWCIGTK